MKISFLVLTYEFLFNITHTDFRNNSEDYAFYDIDCLQSKMFNQNRNYFFIFILPFVLNLFSEYRTRVTGLLKLYCIKYVDIFIRSFRSNKNPTVNTVTAKSI